MTRRKSAAASGRGTSPEKRPRSDSSSKDIPPVPAIGNLQHGSTSLLSDGERARLQLTDLSNSSPNISQRDATNATNGNLDDSAQLIRTASTDPVNGSSAADNKALQRNDIESTPSALATDSPEVGVSCPSYLSHFWRLTGNEASQQRRVH